jgi:Domain of unknown function (DUF3472)
MKAIYRSACLCALITVLAAASAWVGVAPAFASVYTLQLSGGQQLNPGDGLVSPSGLFLLAMQSDGNLVLYSPGHIAIWASNTAGHSGSVLQMQNDGNLVVYAPGHVKIWATNTQAHPGTVLQMQDDANAVLYAPGHAAIWATNTARGQQQNANLYSDWAFQGSGTGYWNVDQQMKVEQRAPATYWAMLWTWAGASYGGYLGLQTDGNRLNGTTGDTAIFSLWNANAVSGSNCGTFGGEGGGYTCRLAYPIAANTYYRYRIWRGSSDSGGQWWGAWVEDTSTGVDTYLGSIRVSGGDTLATGVANFVEYFGTAVTCTTVPRSQAVWTQPAANSEGNGSYQYGAQYAGMTKGACTGGSATPVNLGWTSGVRVVLGG